MWVDEVPVLGVDARRLRGVRMRARRTCCGNLMETESRKGRQKHWTRELGCHVYKCPKSAAALVGTVFAYVSVRLLWLNYVNVFSR